MESRTFALRFVSSSDFNRPGIMSVTRLKRKHRKNIARANNKQQVIKNLLRTPTLKNVDLEELKAQFGTSAKISEAVNTVKKAVASATDKVKEVAADATDKVKAAAASAVAAVTPAAEADAPAETSMFDKIKGFASDAVDAVAHSDVVEKAKTAVSDAVEAVTHSDIVERASAAVSDAVDQVKSAVGGGEAAANAEAFDDAEAVTKPVNEDGQEGEHPKPEIAL